MPIESLLKFRNLLQNQKNNSDEVALEGIQLSNPRLNFISNSRSSDVKLIDKFVDLKIYRLGILFFTLLFVILIFVNFLVQKKLDDVNSDLNVALLKAEQLEEKEVFLLDVDKKIKRYKSLTPIKSSFNDSIESVVTTSGLEIDIKQYTVDREKFSIFAVGESPRAFAGLIGLYLEQDNIKNIVLESASMSSYDSTISVSLRGTFR